jgi:Heterokaryon incompatibility protein (HET)
MEPENSPLSTKDETSGKAKKEIERLCFVSKYQRLPTSDDRRNQPQSPEANSPAVQVYKKYAQLETAQALFEKENWVWSHLAGERNAYWIEQAPSSNQIAEFSIMPYGQLDVERKEIRIMELSCIVENDKRNFILDLVPVSLDDNPPFIALSYTWRDPDIVGYFKSTTMEETQLGYNKSVFSILTSLVAPGSTRYLWIDAISINQLDLDERASQVRIMGDIYRSAQQVIVYLEPQHQLKEQSLDLFHITGNILGSLPDSVLSSAVHPSELLKAVDDKGINTIAWVYALMLTQDRYFNRSWVSTLKDAKWSMSTD